MVKLTSMMSRLEKRKILVAGDLILDTYTIGKARRISPEAPVAVVNVIKEENRPGGAGNVALNLVALGSEVILLGRLGSDVTANILKEALDKNVVDISGLYVQSGYSTPLKNRIIADNQQVVRVDYEQVIALNEALEQQIIESLPALFQGVAAVAISDYGKGFLSDTLLAALMEEANKNNIPVVTDPKGINFAKYSGTTIIKPNLSEAYAAAGLMHGDSLDLTAERILKLANANTLMITRSEAGISTFQRSGVRRDFPVRMREIKDVTGAGDTVLAMLTYAMANQLSIDEAAQLCNVAAGIAIERFGCACVTLSDIARRLLEDDVANKVFDDEHLYALKEALKDRKCILLGLSGAQGMTSSIFSSIHRLSKNPENDLIVYLRDSQPNEDFVALLAALRDIKFIVMQHQSLSMLCETIKPEKVYAIVDHQLTNLASIDEFLVQT